MAPLLHRTQDSAQVNVLDPLGQLPELLTVKRGESQDLAHWVAMEFKDLIDVQQLE